MQANFTKRIDTPKAGATALLVPGSWNIDVVASDIDAKVLDTVMRGMMTASFQDTPCPPMEDTI